MKILLAITLSLFSIQVFACPNISGTFKDEDDNLITIIQTACEQTIWGDANGSTTLIADNIERIVEQEGENKAYGKARFTNTDFVLELRVVYSGNVPDDYPTHFITSYHADKKNNLVEKIESTEGVSYSTFIRIK